MLKSFEVVHTINLDDGVETVNGIRNVPKNMKLESVTATEPQDHSALDDF